jgi:hypothetical protein
MAHALGLVSWEEIAESQCGVMSMRSAIEAGLTLTQIRVRLSSGTWQRPMRDVLVTGPEPLTRIQMLWCAIESVGPDAVLGGASAAELDGLQGYEDEQITVLVASGRRVRRRPGVAVRHSACLGPADVRADTLPRRTRPARSIIDMAEWALQRDQARSILAAAVQQRVITVDEMRATLRTRGPITRRTLVTETLDEIDAGAGVVIDFMYSRVEQAYDLPTGRRQAPLVVGRRLRHLDVRYEPWGVRVIIDDDRHDHPGRQRDDLVPASPSADLLDGQVVVRCAADDLRDRPARVGAQVALALRRRGWPGPAGRGIDGGGKLLSGDGTPQGVSGSAESRSTAT